MPKKKETTHVRVSLLVEVGIAGYADHHGLVPLPNHVRRQIKRQIPAVLHRLTADGMEFVFVVDETIK